MKTPIGEVRWFKLNGEPRTNKFDPSKAREWSTELILDNTNHDHAAFLVQLEDQYLVLHGATKKHAHAFPWKPFQDKDKDGNIVTDSTRTVLRFKTTERMYSNGGVSEGPKIMDSAKAPWNPSKDLANGSKAIIAFEIYAWKAPTGNGLSLQPSAVMVVEYIPFNRTDVTDLFDPVPTGFVADDDMPF